MDQILVFPRERLMYWRDRDAGLYSTSAFYAARTMAELPLTFAFAALCALISYCMFGFQVRQHDGCSLHCVLSDV